MDQKNTEGASRRGETRRKKNSDVKIIVKPVYVGKKQMRDVIEAAVRDCCMSIDQGSELTA